MTENPNQKDSGSFVTGFMLGIAAGVVGYFAFGTKRGTQLRSKLQQEWDSARKQLQLETPENNETGVTAVAQNVFGQFKQVVQRSLSEFDALASKTTDAEKKQQKRKKTRSTKFKGT